MKTLVLLLVGLLSMFLQSKLIQGKTFLINCGSNATANADGRKWAGDSIPGDNFTLSSTGIVASTSSINAEPIFGSLLHFFPIKFENYDTNASAFDVSANDLKLLYKFNVSEEISWKSLRNNSVVTSVVKEYFLSVNLSELQIEFVPNVGSFAFVNAVEIIPLPENIFNGSINKVGGDGLKVPLSLSDQGIETMYRLNVGGPALKSNVDQFLYRPWESDESFMFSVNAATTIFNTSNISYVSSNDSSIAPVEVYESARIMSNNEVVEKKFNVSWRFYVDPNFDYLVRLHFCELIYDKSSQRIFKIYINNKTAAENYDVLGPDSLTTASGTDALLNGLEIFKLSKNGNLAYVSERIDHNGEASSSKKPKRKALWEAVGAGVIDEGNTVAIKRAHPLSEQGLKEFETEIEMLSKLRHRHLVSMIGYCEEQREMILVYEFMANGTLRSHLYGSGLPPLTWKQRVDICIGAARGLHYLHTGADRGIIHRDVKTSNILLDENFVAKMSDFGLSKDGPALEHTHVSTAVKGSFGYLDPEYFRRQQLTQKSDVYSFGVVLFEVVCARPVINPSLPKDQINLAEWALRWQRQRSLETVVDPRLEGDYSSESLKKFGEIAEKCLADEGKNRPTMGEVLWHLEYVLQLHEAYKQSVDSESFGSTELGFADLSFITRAGQKWEAKLSGLGWAGWVTSALLCSISRCSGLRRSRFGRRNRQRLYARDLPDN
uniref:Protein kinase domain-containing protein n=1 Tax=Ananas comosus var. bracteatus TaxID=296719 RepID=A0A6V7QX83_ANACO